MKKIIPAPDKYTSAWWHTGAQGAVMATIFLVSPNAPRGDVILLFLLALCPVFYFFSVSKSWTGVIECRRDRWLWMSFLGLALYLHLNALWAPNPSVAIVKAATLTLVFLIAVLMARSFRRQPDGAIASIGKVIVWSAVIGAGVASFEFAAGYPLREALFTAWPSIRPGDNEIKVFAQVNGEMMELAESEFRRYYENIKIIIDPAASNRNATLIMLLLWPALLLAVNQTNRFARHATLVLIAATSALSVALSSSQTAQAALVLSVLVFLAAYYLPRLTHHTIVAAWCIAIIFAVPLAAAPYKLGLDKADWIFYTAQDRIAIWGFTAKQIPKAPILGKGIRSTRVMSKKLIRNAVAEPGDTTMPMRLGRHSHNNYLQIWYELGAVGAALFLFAGLVLLWKMRSLAEKVRPYAYAGFVAACGIAAFGWGLWQTWLLAGYSLSAIFMIFASEFASRRA